MAEIDLLNITCGSVSAPAGCGKTHLIASALQRHVDPKPILILTHTNAGVAALRARLTHMGVPQSAFRITTIDGWGMRLIGTFPQRSGHADGTLDLNNPRDDYPAIRAGTLNILAGDHASGSRTNLSNDQIFRFLENINSAKLSFRQMARDILEDQGEDVNYKSEDAILNKLKRIRDRLKNSEIKNNLNAAIRGGKIKTTKGKVMQKQYSYKFLTGPEKAQLMNKEKNN